MKSPVQLKEDREKRQITFCCADCGSFSIASWVEGINNLEAVIERQSDLAQRSPCKCEPFQPRCGDLIKDNFNRWLQITGVHRHESDPVRGEYEIRVKYIGETIDG